MSKKRTTIILVFLLLITLLFSGCELIMKLLGIGQDDEAILTLTPSSLNVYLDVGDVHYIVVTAQDSNGNEEDFIFATNNNKVTVTKNAQTLVIQAVEEGECWLTITSGSGLIKVVKFFVETAVTGEPSLSVTPTSITLGVGESGTATVSALTAQGTFDTFIAVSNNTNVATVTKNNTVLTVTGVSEGAATITITSGSELTSTIDVTVVTGQAGEASLTLSKSEVTLATGESETVFVTATKADGSTDLFTASSTNTGFASVNIPLGGGQVDITAVNPGTATIIIQTGSGLNGSIFVTVTTPQNLPPAAPLSISISNVTDSSILISWSTVANATGYKLFSSSNNFLTPIYSETNTSYLHSGLIPESYYSYKVKAYNANGDSEFSYEVGVTTESAGVIYYTINGSIDFSDPYSKKPGLIYMAAYTQADENGFPAEGTVMYSPINWPFEYTGVSSSVNWELTVPQGSYYFGAFLDANYNGLFDYGEPSGSLEISQPILINQSQNVGAIYMQAPTPYTIDFVIR